IHVYSTGYMSHDTDYARFFGYLNLFTGAMLLLVLGDNLVVLFIGWEGVGLCSYLLIGFWYDKDGTTDWGDANASAGKKAFIVNRVGDFAFILGMLVLFCATGTLNIQDLAGHTEELLRGWTPLGIDFLHTTIAGGAALLLLIGATGKSAQIPLFVWLPDAMAGPTPVSALIHAATMVTAGVYMVCRLNFVYVLSPTVMGVVALVGGATALFAATIGIVQNDIKKVLAYSTISQLGYMFLGAGVGAFAAGIFHLFTHAFFKACLFLCAGAVIHALHGQQDIMKMGGLRSRLPITRWTFLLSTLAIAGIPIFAGFFSKDEILWKALSTGNPAWPSWFPLLLYVLGMAGAFCTSFYMFRLYFLTFEGPTRVDDHTLKTLHRPGMNMAFPLMVLAFGATILGFLGLPGEKHNFFHHWLAPVLEQGYHKGEHAGVKMVGANALAHNHGLEYGLMGLSVLVALLGILLAFRLFGKGPSLSAKHLASRFSRLHRMLQFKYWVDEIYDAIIVKPLKWVARNVLFKIVDVFFIDLLAVNGSAFVVDGVGRMARWIQNGNLQHYLVAFAVGIAVIIYAVSSPPDNFQVQPNNNVQIGQKVHFDARSADTNDQRNLQYRWDFDGDGKWETGWGALATVNHTYQKRPKGTSFKVILEVQDTRWKTVSRETRLVRFKPTEDKKEQR
ncbi:MAG: NADH-quinone oxidoreductase subunit L, partial [Pseudomonadota bacterium]